MLSVIMYGAPFRPKVFEAEFKSRIGQKYLSIRNFTDLQLAVHMHVTHISVPRSASDGASPSYKSNTLICRFAVGIPLKMCL